MLVSYSKHLWSPDGESWEEPAYYRLHLGGSRKYWPHQNSNHPMDQRDYLSMWGDETREGGCCMAALSGVVSSWEQAFTMHTCAI
eukprot:CAMPEP_0115217112 /NCGR_PEP_ID=MMETSP0270-20121206/25693_1 /TAXON_ID=71861 /ORGANISM="Scrippsiella trochoidea, Strain CCMP3099" /LENGTH=84 /DNA_ID=CAMNT_0002630985 /DNA_START=1 /DNA_END=255 /DNA_ORIENTATION=-